MGLAGWLCLRGLASRRGAGGGLIGRREGSAAAGDVPPRLAVPTTSGLALECGEIGVCIDLREPSAKACEVEYPDDRTRRRHEHQLASSETSRFQEHAHPG